jgi:hypothetical protein
MNITFEKRIYHIEDGADKYEVRYIRKHQIVEYSNSYSFLEYREYENSELTGYWAFEPSEELKAKLIKTIESYE